MERYTTNTMTIERKGIFDKNRKKRFELTFTCKDSKQKKSMMPESAERKSYTGRLYRNY